MTDSPAEVPQSQPPPRPHRSMPAWFFTTLRVLAVALAIYIAWYVAGHWDRWTGAARFETTDDAFISGDVTPIAAKVSGYIQSVAVKDFQPIKKGELIVEIDPRDYDAALVQAKANVQAAKANLANLANQKDVQRSLIRQAEATIDATTADLDRYNLETLRQTNLLKSGVAGTPQGVEQAEDNSKRTAAQLELNKAQLIQQKAILASLDVEQQQLEAQVRAAEAQEALAQNNLDYTRIVSPDNGLVGQRLVRPGQFVNVGTQVIAVVSLPGIWVIANFKETQMTNIRLGQPATIHVDAFPDLKLTGHVDSWSPGTGSTFALLPPDNATGNFTKVVQRVPVKIVLDHHPALGTLVRPGMSVEATIDTSGGSAETAANPIAGTPQIPGTTK
ncbi:MAG: HlyD family secretion protein [Hyphomicrobium sp.]|uniref:HlyD family secretion protein n=1 Tax=Hyphomicrobium sp. TaxID=82 RepID=UPI0039E2EEC9